MKKAELDKYYTILVTADDDKNREGRISLAIEHAQKMKGINFKNENVYLVDDSDDSIKTSKNL